MISLRSLVFVALAPLALTACGRGSTVAIELTDAPIDTSTIDKVEVSFGKVDVQQSYGCGGKEDGAEARHDGRKGGGEWVSVNDKVGTVDLLSLRDGAKMALGEVEVWGKVSGIRLQIDGASTNQILLKDGRTCTLDTSGVTEASISLDEQAAIETERGGRTTILVDFVVEESLTEVAACSFKLAPVLEVKSVTHAEEE